MVDRARGDVHAGTRVRVQPPSAFLMSFDDLREVSVMLDFHAGVLLQPMRLVPRYRRF